MAIKSGREYEESIKKLKLRANVMGQKTGDLPEHELVEPSQKAVTFTFDAAKNNETKNLFCVESTLCKDVVNRFTHLHQSTGGIVISGAKLHQTGFS